MTPFDFTVYAAGVCGVSMVAGAIWLLRTGVIKLSEAGQSGALSVEVLEKIKVSTRYPALALFIIGLSFLALPIFFVKPSRDSAFTLMGKIPGDASSINPAYITISVHPEGFEPLVFNPLTGGIIRRTYPMLEVRQLLYEINVPGYEPFTGFAPIGEARGGEITFQNVVLNRLEKTKLLSADEVPAGEIITASEKLAPMFR